MVLSAEAGFEGGPVGGREDVGDEVGPGDAVGGVEEKEGAGEKAHHGVVDEEGAVFHSEFRGAEGREKRDVFRGPRFVEDAHEGEGQAHADVQAQTAAMKNRLQESKPRSGRWFTRLENTLDFRYGSTKRKNPVALSFGETASTSTSPSSSAVQLFTVVHSPRKSSVH